MQADDDVLVGEAARRTDVEAGILDRRAGEQQASLFDGQILAVGFERAVDLDLPASYRRLAGQLDHRELAAEIGVEAEADQVHLGALAQVHREFFTCAEFDRDLDFDRRIGRRALLRGLVVDDGRAAAGQLGYVDEHLRYLQRAADAQALGVAVDLQIRGNVYFCAGNVRGEEAVALDRQRDRRVGRDAGAALECELAFVGGDRAVDVEVLAVARTHADVAVTQLESGGRHFGAEVDEGELAVDAGFLRRSGQRELCLDLALGARHLGSQQIDERETVDVEAEVAGQWHRAVRRCGAGDDAAVDATAVVEVARDGDRVLRGRQGCIDAETLIAEQAFRGRIGIGDRALVGGDRRVAAQCAARRGGDRTVTVDLAFELERCVGTGELGQHRQWQAAARRTAPAPARCASGSPPRSAQPCRSR